jgi:hypothetical protein
MPRKDKNVSHIKESTTDEEFEKLDVPHHIKIDPDIDIVGIPLSYALKILDKLERPIEAFGLYMVYRTLYQQRKHVPSAKTLMKKFGIGRDKLKTLRNILKEANLIKDINIKDKSGKFLTKVTKLRGTGFPSDGKHVPYIINNNINTPDSEGTESGCVCSCSCHGNSNEKEKTPKSFPREQDFNALWSINRRKVNKDEARKAWKSKPVQKSLPPKDVLLEAYEADAQDNKWDEADEKYVPHLSTWLRNRRWKNHTGEPKGEGGALHIMDQLRRSDGIEGARQLREELLEEHKARTGTGFRGKTAVRAYVKWLAGPDSPPAGTKDSLRDVLITDRNQSRYWDAYVEAGMPGMAKEEEF